MSNETYIKIIKNISHTLIHVIGRIGNVNALFFFIFLCYLMFSQSYFSVCGSGGKGEWNAEEGEINNCSSLKNKI